MADELIVPALEMLRQADPTEPADFVRQATERVARAIVELQQKIGVARYERTETRTNSRNGSRPRDGDTTAGTVGAAQKCGQHL
jgi:putative transposase